MPPMLMFDRITHISDDGGANGKGNVEAEFDIKPDLWFFKCHFEGDPVMPGCLGMDGLWQLLGFTLGWLGGPGSGGKVYGTSFTYSKTSQISVGSKKSYHAPFMHGYSGWPCDL